MSNDNAQVRTSEVLDWTIGKFTNEELERAKEVHWKSEDDVDGLPIGPIFLLTDTGFAKAPSWYPRRDAEALADDLGLPFVEV